MTKMFFVVIGMMMSMVLSAVEVPSQWSKARVLRGLWGEGCDDFPSDGTCELKCGKANNKGISRVSLTITPFDGKKITYKAVAVDVSNGSASVRVEWQEKGYFVEIDGDTFFGEPIYGDSRPCCMPNSVRSSALGGLIDAEELSFDGGLPTFPMPEGWTLLECLLPRGLDLLVENGRKLTCYKAMKIAYQRLSDGDDYYYDMMFPTCVECTNYSGLRLSYAYNKGMFRGSYTIYATDAVEEFPKTKPKLKRYKVSVSGAFSEGRGLGKAFLKVKGQSYSWPVYITEGCEW